VEQQTGEDEPLIRLDGNSDVVDEYDAALVKTIVEAADDRKAEDIAALFVGGGVSTLTSFLVVLTGKSRPQNQAIAKSISDSVQELLKTRSGRKGGSVTIRDPVLPEGTAESGWMLLDYGSVMVHIMTPKSRLYYNIEKQWRDKGGVPVDLSDVLLMQAPTSSNSGGDGAFGTAQSQQQQLQVEEEEEEEADPFWS